MFDQRNQQFSTILLATTIMLSALVCCLAQGVLPDGHNLDKFIYNLYAIATSLSVAFLFVCLVFCIEVMWRASEFMYKRSKLHTGYLAKAIKKTKDMMSAIRGVKAREKSETVLNRNTERNARRRNISKMNDGDVEKEFVNYESEINYYHANREAMIDDSAYMVTADDGSVAESKSFEKFWHDSCSFYGNAAILTFYAGSAALFFANVTFMWATNLYTYKSLRSAKVSVTVVLSSLIVSMVLLIYMRYIEKISMDNSAAANASGAEAYSWGAFRSSMANLSLSSRQSSRLSSSRGFGGMSSYLRSSNKQSSDCGSISDVDDSSRSQRDRVSNSESRSAVNRTSSKKNHFNLPVATSLDIPLNFDTVYDNAGNSCNPIPTADATYPSVMISTGIFERG
jgi:hypothetical protein